MERKSKTQVSKKCNLNTNIADTQNSFTIPTTVTSVSPAILPPPATLIKDAAGLYRNTRQRTNNTALQQNANYIVNNTATEKIHSQLTSQLQSETAQENPHNNKTMGNQILMCAKATTSITSPLEKQAAVYAKATSSRNKNEEAINDLKMRIPEIENIFDIHSRIGNGTFSTVLLGTLKKQRNLPENLKRKFAIKHHIPTSHPDRIMKELQCMAKIGGTNNVVGINCCIRCNESVAFVMPFLAHDRFHDFYNKMDVIETKFYMKNLLMALRHVHRFNVIHRDVKPSNFLYNRSKRQFLLVDFGLAQQIINNNSSPTEKLESGITLGEGKRSREEEATKSSERATAVTSCSVGFSGPVKRLRYVEPEPESLSTAIMPTVETTRAANTASKGAPTTGGDNASPKERKTPAASNTHTMSSRLQQKLRAQGGAESLQHSSTRNSSAGGSKNTPPVAQTANANNNNNNNDGKYNTNRNLTALNSPKCYCYGNHLVCNICLVKKEIHASRAGTPGYRPPEVLLKYPDQTTAVDIWASGVIFLSILSSVYPFFKAPNDFVALAEMITIFGDKTIRKTAYELDRLVTHSQKTKPLDLRKLCVRFRNRAKFSSPELLMKYAYPDGTCCEICLNCDQFCFNCLCMETAFVTEPLDADDIFPPSAYDLLYRLLEINPHKRITADEALQHPFFLECHNNDNITTSKSISSPVKTSAAVLPSSSVTLNTPLETPLNLVKKTRN